jgi:hypothetical protein
MGLTCTLFRASVTEIAGLVDAPDAVDTFYRGVEGEGLPVREVRPKGLKGLLLRLTPITITEVVPPSERGSMPEPARPDADRMIEIEDVWHDLHFLFTGKEDSDDEPACYLMSGGTALDDEGSARALGPQQTRRFAEFVLSLTPDDLRYRHDVARSVKSGVRTGDRTDGTGDDTPFDRLLEAFTELQKFVRTVAAAGDGLIIRIS